MKIKVCPKDPNHNEFLTTASVNQTWKIDGEGNFLEEVSTDDTIHGPDIYNEWTCSDCGSQAIIEVRRM